MKHGEQYRNRFHVITSSLELSNMYPSTHTASSHPAETIMAHRWSPCSMKFMARLAHKHDQPTPTCFPFTNPIYAMCLYPIQPSGNSIQSSRNSTWFDVLKVPLTYCPMELYLNRPWHICSQDWKPIGTHFNNKLQESGYFFKSYSRKFCKTQDGKL